MISNKKAYLSLALVCLLWGTTNLATKIGLQSFPPFMFIAIRQIMAGALLISGILLFKKPLAINWKQTKQQVFLGMLIITLGNGLMCLSVKYIPSGLATLIHSMVPVYVMIMTLFSAGAKRPDWKVFSGILLGVIGMIMVFKDSLSHHEGQGYLTGMAICVASCLAWSAGSIYSNNLHSKTNSFLNAGLQLGSGGVMLLLMSVFFDDWTAVGDITRSSILALGYLIIFGSVIAFTCYHYALSFLPVNFVSVYAYVNPLVAIIFGFIILKEPISLSIAFAFIVIVGSVFLVSTSY